MKIVSIEHMRRIEAEADSTGISYDMMMERAGTAAAQIAAGMIQGIEQARVTLLIGGGNNGGDGLVAGRVLADLCSDAQIRFYLLKDREDDPLLAPLREAGHLIANAADDRDKRVLRNMVASADLLIDALFGIGIRLPIKDEAETILRQTNRVIAERAAEQPEEATIDPLDATGIRSPRIRVLAIDCPSGLNTDTGETDANTIPADKTISFIAAKPGLVTFPGAANVGHLHIATLGIPASLKSMQETTPLLATPQMIRSLLPDRPVNSHKGTYGTALIVGGSINYIGAAGLSARAAYRAGAGLVSVAAPAPVIHALAGSQPETTWMLLPHDLGVASSAAAKIILEGVQGAQALLLGPGLGQEQTTADLLLSLLQTHKHPNRRSIGFSITPGDENSDTAAQNDDNQLPPLIIDADGLNLLAKQENWWKLLPPETILTPHPGEMARLCSISTAEVQSNRLQLAQEKASEWGVILVLKGAHTIIATPEDKLIVLPFKSDGLATAGTGDVLAGLITGFRAQGCSAYAAAACGAFVHGLAAIHAQKRQGTRALNASDLLDSIGPALTQLAGS